MVQHVLHIDQDTKRKNLRKYLCSNPNCRKVFSKPKIIKYHVCPACQTLVNMTEADSEEIQNALAMQKTTKRRKPKMIERSGLKSQEKPGIQVPLSKPTKEEFPAPENEPEMSKKVTPCKQVQVPLQNEIRITPPQSSTTRNSPSSVCQHHFGYLSQHEKNEGIPDSCIVCPKSLSCMLSEYYKDKESVIEIKKWYSP